MNEIKNWGKTIKIEGNFEANEMKISTVADKTLFIKEIFNNEFKNILITVPHDFGKNTNMEMLKEFLEIQVDGNGNVIDRSNSTNLFKKHNLQIYDKFEKFSEQNFQAYPVIYVEIKDAHRKISFIDVVNHFRSVLNELFQRHSYLLKSTKLDAEEISQFKKYYDENLYKILNKTEIIKGLGFLSECLCKHFDGKKIFLLIENYDYQFEQNLFEEYIYHFIDLYKQILSNSLNSEFVERTVLTGVNYLSSVILSGVDNLGKYKFLGSHPFMQYLGLNELELDTFLVGFEANHIIESYKKSCNGYVSLSGKKLFSIESVLHSSQLSERFSNKFKSPCEIRQFNNLLDIPIIRYAFEKLCLKQFLLIEILEDIEIQHITELNKIFLNFSQPEVIQLQKPDLLLNYFLHEGYLSYGNTRIGNSCNVELARSLFIDNFKNILNIYHSIQCMLLFKPPAEKCTYRIGPYGLRTDRYYTDDANTCGVVTSCVKECAKIFDKISLNSLDYVFITDFINMYREIFNKLGFQTEETYHNFMFNILCKTNFLIVDDGLSFTDGKPDLIFYKENLGIIVKVQCDKCSKAGLQQIIEQNAFVFEQKCLSRNITDKIYLELNINDTTIYINVLVNSTNLSDVMCFPQY